MGQPKHEIIRNELRLAITSGKYKEGERLPTEAQLVEQYSTSRPTVARALRELQRDGLILRRAGSGTYVKKPSEQQGQLFGLVIPRLGETEIFEPMCRELARSSQINHHGLLWAATAVAATGDVAEEAWQSCQQCIKRKVAGVFFAPLELIANAEVTNERIVSALDNAGIPIVLLDRDLYRSPRRSRYDRVGIDNRAAGFTVTDHLLKHGCRKVGFISRPYSAETVGLRLDGYHQALRQHEIVPDPCWVAVGDPSDPAFMREFVYGTGIEGLVCANDMTAANVIRTLDALGIKTPQDVRVVGFDDVKYASLLRVPLTTLRQPCEHIGAAAVRAMIERISNSEIPPRDILLHCQLVVRDSCGAHLEQSPSPVAAVFLE
jgi:GntR family transcriptional regulator, arabinose operon transcriptional repressor